MSKEDRAHFEKVLSEELQEIECNKLDVKAIKNGVRFKLERKIVAELDFQYLVKSHAFSLLGRVIGGPIYDCMSTKKPPYKSNLCSEACYSFTTSGRQDKKISDSIYGTVSVPDPDNAFEVCRGIRDALEHYYIPVLTGCIFPDHRTISDVFHSPTDYSYPAIFIHCAALLNPSILDNEAFNKIKNNKKIIKNKDYDFDLLNKILSSN
ncbi:hypothetical protein BZK31_23775 [Pseudomonas floridensis]|uniref:Uncharacterized protein n=1 Tax=Pseudomonas floridensis TaxID=1958950 RepID=A0A1X0MZP7_9PSED|nr:hypothetical protein [Pseudomonas floridensis]ORC56176.1 hypothetical protein BZK31_23775 [Pseudomonas floridensis]